MFKRLSLLLILVLVFSLAMAGCAQQAQPGASEAGAGEEDVAPGAEGPITLEFWIFADFATGPALDLFNTFIEEFEAAHPDITVELIGKPAPDIISGIVAGAGSGELPDVVTTQLGAGGQLLASGALLDISPYWNEMSDEWRAQFTPSVVEILNQNGSVWGIPFTGYATVLYRNRTVLENAGIDPDAGIADWDEWLAQMEQVQASGAFATARILQNSWAQLHYYGGIPGAQNGVSEDGSQTLLEADKLAQVYTFLKQAQAYGAEVPFDDQAATDLFVTNQLAFISTGPWFDVTLAQAKAEGTLDYDFVLIPGAVAEEKGGVMGGEFIAVLNGPEAEAAWEFAKFITDSPQMARFAAGLGRYVSNELALQDPGVQENALVLLTGQAANESVPEGPFFFQTPPQYSQPLADFGTLVSQGAMEPEEAATQAIEAMNQLLQEALAE